VVPFQFIETADGYLALACPKEKFFQVLVDAIDLPHLAQDPRFASIAARREHRAALVEILGERFRQRTTGEWLALLKGRVPCAPVRSLAEALDRQELEERGMLASYPHPTFGQVRAIGAPFTLSDFKPGYRAGPALNGDQQDILEAFGFDVDERAELAAAGAFGSS
jgi:crotonobetainyl-CoA:carnitine CoA-transferase CaiB-like acyl-CoA transferase